jgi:hypothetical protein
MNLIKPKRLTIETGEVFCYQWVGTAYIFLVCQIVITVTKVE